MNSKFKVLSKKESHRVYGGYYGPIIRWAGKKILWDFGKGLVRGVYDGYKRR